MLELAQADQVAESEWPGVVVFLGAAGVLELPHADQVAGSEEVLIAGTLEVVLEELHSAHDSAEAMPATAATVATENFILIEVEVLVN